MRRWRLPKHRWCLVHKWVCLKMLCTPKANGFADHYPYEKWLFHWEYTQHFQTNPNHQQKWLIKPGEREYPLVMYM